MAKKMLIDATHREETRVAVLDSERLIEFDYESAFRKPLKGSVFLAKVTRVEPSLQAAFVNFGGNRHGFLPFSEIHPDYFRIPIADREALLAEQEEEMAREQEEEDDVVDDEGSPDEGVLPGDEELDSDADADADEGSQDNDDESEQQEDKSDKQKSGSRKRRNANSKKTEKSDNSNRRRRSGRRFNLRRQYKIQEVIKRGQIMLVQVSREERGNKGAAVSTYLSLPGRYSVLMPNSPHAGGVSRKISSGKDRSRLKEIIKELDLPKGMSVILRTAGVQRTKTEIKRDLDYLMRLWNNIRELTLESTAPALIYEEANLIKRSIRDLYTRDIDEVIVAGEEGYKAAKEFMKMMIPSHAKRVKLDKPDDIPLFQRYHAEDQITEIGDPHVTLKSGGSIVINPTEALVAIDVNSGKATKERHIEETALKTNLEAAEEVVRQLRLRDLGGLIVIDFIDMENRRNNARVERLMRDKLSTDRARVQVGKISPFGLMELSRQRMNPSLTESQYETCTFCAGLGRVRTPDAQSILVLRALEDEGVKRRASQVIAHISGHVALYLLNYKRRRLSEIEERYGFTVEIRIDEKLSSSEYRLEVARPLSDDEDEASQEEEQPQKSRKDRSDNNDDDQSDTRSGRRRGRRGGRKSSSRSKSEDAQPTQDSQKPDEADKSESKGKNDSSSQSDKDDNKKPAKRTRKSSETASKEKKSSDQEENKEEKGGQKETRSKAAKAQSSKAKDTDQPKKSGKSVKASNDDVPEKNEKDDEENNSSSGKKEPASSVEYEVVNAPPSKGKKKKGWWNRLVE